MEGVCEKILQYNVHAERPGSLRYSKGESQTMGTLKGLKLVNLVKVMKNFAYNVIDNFHKLGTVVLR